VTPPEKEKNEGEKKTPQWAEASGNFLLKKEKNGSPLTGLL
jgi:hypothetical protein